MIYLTAHEYLTNLDFWINLSNEKQMTLHIGMEAA